MAASSIGTLIGGVYLSIRSNVFGFEKPLAFGPIIMGVSLTIFALSHILWLSLLALAIAGFGFILQIISGRTVLQLLVTDEMRGQITGLYVMASTGAVPVGNLIAGILASYIGAVNTVIFGASACIVGSLLFMQQISLFRELVDRNINANIYAVKKSYNQK